MNRPKKPQDFITFDSKTIYTLRRSCRCLLLLLFLLLASRLTAQQQWLFAHLGKKEGLASDIVNGVQQDAKGYIWIATMAGLERYDGHRFLLFRHNTSNPANPKSLPNDKVVQILLDQHNRLWMLLGFNTVGYLDLDDQHFHLAAVQMKEEDLRRADAQLFSTRAGGIVLLVKKHGAFGYDEKSLQFTTAAAPFPLPPRWGPLCMTQDSTGNTFWIGCDSGLVKYTPSNHLLSWRDHNPDHDPVITHFADRREVSIPYMDHAGRFWLETWPVPGWYGLYTYDTHTGKEKKWEPLLLNMLRSKYHDVHYFGEMTDGTIWLGGTNLLACLKKNSENFEALTSQQTGEFNLHYDLTQHILEDREHNIWISTDKGLYRFNPRAQIFHTIINRRPGRDTIFTPDVTDILQAKNGEIYVTTWGNGVFAYDSNFTPLNSRITARSLHNKEIMTWCIHQRPNGDIWRGNQDGMLAITHAGRQTDSAIVLPVFRNSTIRQITEDRNGDLWLGTQKGDLIKWQAATNQFSWVRNMGSSIHRLYTDRHGDIWVCTFKNGVYAIDPRDSRVLYHYSSEGPGGQRLQSIGAMDIVQYSDSLFVIASGALHILNEYTHKVRVVGAVGGVPDNTITNLVMDKNGFIWAATQSGLCKIDLRNEARSTFNESDGIGSNTFNIGSAAILKDGRIALGTAHDLMVWQPGDIATENQQPPDIEIGNMALMNKWLSMDSLSHLDHIELPYNENALRIVFATLTYQNTFGVFYKLENLDKDWIAAESSEAIYSYIPPGQYIFKIEARNSIGQPSIHRKEIRITVFSPFWRTWGFYAAMALLAAAFLYGFDRQRMKRKEVMQKIRSNISDNLHEDIHTALQHINVLSEIARIKADKAPDQSINYINEIHHKSRSMIIALEDMLWSIDPANDNMARAIARMKEFAEALSQNPGVRIEVQADDRVLFLRPDMKIRHELMQVYRLSLRLLVEEMRARHTIVQLDYERPRLLLSFFAAGLRPDTSNHSVKLLEEIKTRGHSIGGTLDLQFDDKGAAIIFICPSIS